MYKYRGICGKERLSVLCANKAKHFGNHLTRLEIISIIKRT